MKVEFKDWCNYIAGLLAFLGTLFMIYATVEIKEITSFDEQCMGHWKNLPAETVIQLMKKCAYHPVGMRWPLTNSWGFYFLCAGFMVQVLPGIYEFLAFAREKTRKFSRTKYSKKKALKSNPASKS